MSEMKALADFLAKTGPEDYGIQQQSPLKEDLQERRKHSNVFSKLFKKKKERDTRKTEKLPEDLFPEIEEDESTTKVKRNSILKTPQFEVDQDDKNSYINETSEQIPSADNTNEKREVLVKIKDPNTFKVYQAGEGPVSESSEWTNASLQSWDTEDDENDEDIKVKSKAHSFVRKKTPPPQLIDTSDDYDSDNAPAMPISLQNPQKPKSVVAADYQSGSSRIIEGSQSKVGTEQLVSESKAIDLKDESDEEYEYEYEYEYEEVEVEVSDEEADQIKSHYDPDSHSVSSISSSILDGLDEQTKTQSNPILAVSGKSEHPSANDRESFTSNIQSKNQYSVVSDVSANSKTQTEPLISNDSKVAVFSSGSLSMNEKELNKKSRSFSLLYMMAYVSSDEEETMKGKNSDSQMFYSDNFQDVKDSNEVSESDGNDFDAKAFSNLELSDNQKEEDALVKTKPRFKKELRKLSASQIVANSNLLATHPNSFNEDNFVDSEPGQNESKDSKLTMIEERLDQEILGKSDLVEKGSTSRLSSKNEGDSHLFNKDENDQSIKEEKTLPLSNGGAEQKRRKSRAEVLSMMMNDTVELSSLEALTKKVTPTEKEKEIETGIDDIVANSEDVKGSVAIQAIESLSQTLSPTLSAPNENNSETTVTQVRKYSILQAVRAKRASSDQAQSSLKTSEKSEKLKESLLKRKT